TSKSLRKTAKSSSKRPKAAQESVEAPHDAARTPTTLPERPRRSKAAQNGVRPAQNAVPAYERGAQRTNRRPRGGPRIERAVFLTRGLRSGHGSIVKRFDKPGRHRWSARERGIRAHHYDSEVELHR